MSAKPTPFLPETPWDAVGAVIREVVRVADRDFRIERPSPSELMLDHPVIMSAIEREEYLPYWADLWPAARMLAKAVLAEPWPSPAPAAIEIGCGLGLPGLAALACGMKVTFTDCDHTALRFANANARLNGFTNFEILPLDWRAPPEGLHAPVLLGSDLTYERRHVEPLATLIAKMLTPGGVCLLTDQDRAPAQFLQEALVATGLTFTTKPMRAGEPGGSRFKGTLYRIQHGGAA